ncbi:chain length-determining protein [Aestuariicella hydrocarbonica]|uniref:Chain length-determining protein n=1 Tax=Pseudomaricurvus hydrocarbonicus TaxID=1470433 RepID=A0A9E5MLU8_9GAMM|nr:XrtA system polysaccharide chain length determinant [Aestuariicella hydrocarbonica]NHO64700.1 chain length-determining protein [Aestuariicella hydrocarbonica]
MQQVFAQIYSYLLGIWRFRWYGLAIAWVVAILGWLWVWSLPVSYMATARLDVDSSSVLRPLLRGLAIQPDVNQRVALMSRTLLSRPNLEKLMRMSDLDLNITTDLEKEQLLTGLKESITLQGDAQNTSLYSLSFKHEDRDSAKRIVQSLITVFIESTLGEKRNDNSSAHEFLEQQIADYAKRLSEAEERLANFKQKNVNMLPGDSGGYYQRLDMAKSQLRTADLELRELENRKEELNRQLNGDEPVFFSSSIGDVTRSTPIDVRINSLKTKLDHLALTYTNRHPEMIQIKSMIASLEAEKKIEYSLAAGLQSSSMSNLTSSPVYQNMRTMLAETEAKVAEVKVRVDEYKKRVNELEGTVNNIPNVEVQLRQLDRDYKVVLDQHNQLLARRESALLSEEVEKNTDNIKFRVIDPPFVPLKPSEPNKLLLNSGVLLLSIVAGLAFTFLLSLIRPVFVTRQELGETLGLPVFGSVSMIVDPVKARHELQASLIFVSVSVCLLVTFAGVNLGQNLFF